MTIAQHHWTRTEQIQFLVDETDPPGAPGEVYKYSDTGYVLLGEIIERVSGKALGPVVRELLNYEKLGLNATWWEIVEPEPKSVAPRVSQYMNELKTNDWHASLDLYGGGGLVASVPDLAGFFKALFEGKVYENPATLALMKTTIIPEYKGPTFEWKTVGPTQYCMGLFAYSYADYTIFEHGGVWGTDGGYVPALDLAFAFGITQFNSWPYRYLLLHSLMDVVIDSQKSK